MDAKSRKALIDSLVADANFEATYTPVNQRWMVTKLLGVVESRVAGDAAIKARTKDVVTKAKALAKKHRDFKLTLGVNRKEVATERGLRQRRVEILYGMIAYEPDLTDAANEQQLSFTARRRYRAITRFQFFINPNGRGYLRYASTCKANQRWRVNVDADPFWVHVNATGNYPVKLRTPPNPPDVVKALDKFFTAKPKKGEECIGNLFDCATALSVVYMDSLLEAKTAKTLLDHLYARAPPLYLSIDHVHRFNTLADLADAPTRNTYFIMDVSAKAMFDKTFVKKEDLQVGDHVYIHNHGLYKRLRADGAWQGEHALLTDCGNRALQDDKGFRFMGHGMPLRGETGAIPRFYGNLLNELNTLITRFYQAGGRFLLYKKSNDTAFPGKVTKQTATVTDSGGASQTADFYFFDIDFEYRDSLKKPPKGKQFAKTTEHGFVAWHIAATREFGIHEKKTIAEARAAGIASFSDGVRFTRLNPGSATTMFDPEEWAIPYPDNDDNELLHFVFQKKGAGMQPLLLEMWELYSEPLGKFGRPGDEVLTTRPNVDVSSPYTSFLTANGAI